MQKIITTFACFGILTTTLASSQIMAETEAQDDHAPRIINPYGNNPNIAHVLAYKTQELVIDGAQKVGEVTEKGIAKIKPSVDRVWERTQNIASGNTESSSAATSDTSSGQTNRNNTPIIEHQSLTETPSHNQQLPAQTTPPAIQTPNTAQSYAITDL